MTPIEIDPAPTFLDSIPTPDPSLYPLGHMTPAHAFEVGWSEAMAAARIALAKTP